MAPHSQVLTPAQSFIQPAFQGDLRRHRRVPLELAGRFMRENRDEFACKLKDISVGGAYVETGAQVEISERVIAYFEDLGGIEGKVSRKTDLGFAFQFSVSDHKREKLAAQITWLLNRSDFPEELSRQHDRMTARGRRTTMRFDDGMLIDVELIDISASGASIRTPARPLIGEEVTLGKVRAAVRRHHPDGLGVQFFTVLTPAVIKTLFP